ncbi:efflux RND transporter periplasmic adaptor subunit [Candidatus Parcubacteria bacterium]|nr:efflux RND transporter periplasmic adaptor subunit [Candidatus Parcubacteria bacterium]
MRWQKIIFWQYAAAGFLAVSLAGVGVAWWASRNAEVQHPTAAVTRETVRRTLSATGKVTSTKDLPLSFSVAGTLRRLTVKAGDHVVREGAVLAELENSELRAAVLEARAKLKSAQAELILLQGGPRPEDVALAAATLERSRQEHLKVENDLGALRKSLAAAVEAARLRYIGRPSEALPAGTNTSSAVPVVSGTYTGSAEGVYRVRIVSSSFYDVSGLETATAVPISRIGQTPVGVKGLFIQFSREGTINTGDEWTITVPDNSAPAYGADFAAYQRSLADEHDRLAEAEAAVELRAAALREAEASAAKISAPIKPEDVIAAEARVLAAEAALARAQSTTERAIVRAPAAGVIISVLKTVGQFLPAGEPVLTILDVRERHIEAEITLREEDPLLKADQPVQVRFPAVGSGRVFTQKVLAVEPISTGSGDSRYKITVNVPDLGAITVGARAELFAVVAQKQNVFAVPSAAVRYDRSRSFVTVLAGGRLRERAIEVGVRGDELTEITSGLTLGEQVVLGGP